MRAKTSRFQSDWGTSRSLDGCGGALKGQLAGQAAGGKVFSVYMGFTNVKLVDRKTIQLKREQPK